MSARRRRSGSSLLAPALLALSTLGLGAYALPAVAHGPTSDGVTALALRSAQSLQAAADTREAFDYRVSMADPHRHEFSLSLRFRGLPADATQFELPKWNPGAYRLTDAHRNLRAVVARPLDEAGKPEADASLPVAKLDENTWSVAHGGADFELSYRVYCGRYTGIAGCYLDDAMGFFNGVYLFMYAVGHKHRPVELRLEALPGGKGAEAVTGLPAAKGSSKRKPKFWADNFDTLVDSPVSVAEVESIEFELRGKPIRAVMAGEGHYDKDRVRDELMKITESSAAIFGEGPSALPFSDYTFIYHLRPDNGGGLEHANSTVIGLDPWLLADDAGRRRFWSVTAHEFFHLWNVKRIRPAVLGPFDYDREVHTTMLWFSEGFTSYYAALILSRAGLYSEEHTLGEFARRIAAVETKPGRKLMSVEQSSWETWAGPDDYQNASFSYYDKGMIVGMLLDLQLRAASKGRASTDTVFRELWQRWRDTGLGLTPAELEAVFLAQAGGDAEAIEAIFRDYVHGTKEVDYDRYLEHAGYRLDRSVKDPGPWIAADIGPRGDAVVLRSVEHGGPADEGGLGNGDVLVAIGGYAVDRHNYQRVLAAMEIGEPVSFTLDRDGRILEREVVPVEGGETKFEIVSLDEVSAEQALLREQWLGLKD